MAATRRPAVLDAHGAAGLRCGLSPPCSVASRPAHCAAAHRAKRTWDVCMAASSNGGSLQLSPLCDAPGNPTAVGIMYKRMREAGVAPASCDQLLRRQRDGIPVVDVRPRKSYEAAHIPDSLSIPLYDLIEGWSPFKVGKRFNYLLFGKMDGTEMQKDFLNVCAEKCDLEKGVTLVCNVGFTAPEYPEDFAGFATRSLIAAHELVANGFKNVRILERGISEFEESDRELATGE